MGFDPPFSGLYGQDVVQCTNVQSSYEKKIALALGSSKMPWTSADFDSRGVNWLSPPREAIFDDAHVTG